MFFFKQKTAYEMRISDWSSDVCSSDLTCAATASDAYCWRRAANTAAAAQARSRTDACRAARSRTDRKSTRLNQSLMRISYAVFCLKKTNCSSKRTVLTTAAMCNNMTEMQKTSAQHNSAITAITHTST